MRQRRSAAVGIAEQAIKIGLELLQPAVVTATFAVVEFRHEQVRFEGGGHLGGPLVAEHFRSAPSVVVVV
jgi:hypothetical protein